MPAHPWISRPIGITHCEHCGRELTKEQRRQRQRFCSRRCSPQRPIGGERQCACCGNMFRPAESKQRFCSVGCVRLMRSIGKACAIHFFQCSVCGKIFSSRRGGKRTVCSRRCRWRRTWEGIKADPARMERIREKSRRRRASMAGAQLGPNLLLMPGIYERDGGRCAICHRKVSLRVRWPAPLSATLDHIVPLSAGGSHTIENLTLAHLGCNLKRHTRGAAQLRLSLPTPHEKRLELLPGDGGAQLHANAREMRQGGHESRT